MKSTDAPLATMSPYYAARNLEDGRTASVNYEDTYNMHRMLRDWKHIDYKGMAIRRLHYYVYHSPVNGSQEGFWTCNQWERGDYAPKISDV